MAKKAIMPVEELAEGNSDFIFSAAYNIGTDPAFREMLKRAESEYARARYDGLQEKDPPLGYIFADPEDAGEILSVISSYPMIPILSEFMEKVHEDHRKAQRKYFKREDNSIVEVPLIRDTDGTHLIYLEITGYTLGGPTFQEITNPLEQPPGTMMERLSKIGHGFI